MAESPSHRFGQIVGNLLEDILRPVLERFCKERGLYLDSKGERPGVRRGRKVTWIDKYGNNHDLDFVIEKAGTPAQKGRPIAFIECAWRRYTKHSRNKAQEIQGAIVPIADDCEWDKPFLGAVLAGVFTKGSLDQLESVGFHVLYFPYDSVVAAFDSVGIDVRFDESTPDEDFRKCVESVRALAPGEYETLKAYLARERQELVASFLTDLGAVLDRMIERLIVVPLFGDEHVFGSVNEAMKFIERFSQTEGRGAFRKYEIIATYSNGDGVTASFRSKSEAEKFLRYLAA